MESSMKAASGEVSRQFKTLINAEDVESLKQLQHLILGRLQDSNAVLSHFNEYSEQCYAEISGDFLRNTRLLKSMKSDLDHIFQKLRPLVEKFGSSHCGYFGHGPSKAGTIRSSLDPTLSIHLKRLLSYQQSGSHTHKVLGPEDCIIPLSMKTKILTTYPDAFPVDSASVILDQRPDLERAQ